MSLYSPHAISIKTIICTIPIIFGMLSGCASKTGTAAYSVVPIPQEIIYSEGSDFILSDKTVIVTPGDNDTITRYAEFLSEYINEFTGNKLAITTENHDNDAIILTTGFDNANRESYRITVNNKFIIVDGATAAGVLYGVQTLRKSITQKGDNIIKFSAVRITDYPRFGYRGAHLDVSRHFFPADSVKKFLDMLLLHNINTMHWHLTDDQGWRIEIKSRPKLTEIASQRGGTVIGHNSGVYDSIPHGGYYTQNELRDVIKYAADRNINIIPEIDLPGHMVAALTAYPHLGCTGGPYEVWQQWGVSEDLLCAGNDSTYKFLEDVLGEITELFPSKLIHIGGDECPKTRWENCLKCQNKIRELGIKASHNRTKEQQLQSHVMEYASKYLASRGRRIIGWDEILEGGISEDAIVMSWRGISGGIEGVKSKHDVIMTPNTYLYFDYYQSTDCDNEPIAFGSYIPVEKVYSYEPYPTSLNNDECKQILGVQANLWTEYISEYSQVEYMELPRMAALSEVQWTMPEKKDYEGFTKRLPQIIAHYDVNGYNYARHIFNVTPSFGIDTVKHAITASFSTIDNAIIRYTLDDSEPTEMSPVFKNPIDITSSCQIKAAAFRPSGRSTIHTDSITFNKATARPIKIAHAPHKQYEAHGTSTLNDGQTGAKGYNKGGWVGWIGDDMIATVDLQKIEEVSTVSLNTCIETGSWIFDTTGIKIELSNDDINYHTVATETIPELSAHESCIKNHTVNFPKQEARYVRLTAAAQHIIPDWHPGKGYNAFLFVDEISIK